VCVVAGVGHRSVVNEEPRLCGQVAALIRPEISVTGVADWRGEMEEIAGRAFLGPLAEKMKFPVGNGSGH